ncbi:14309_t:CDS:2, partial [Cetraspora pellucida]
KMRSGSSWWNGYEGQDILFLDEFYTKIDWNTMVNLLNDSNHKVQKDENINKRYKSTEVIGKGSGMINENINNIEEEMIEDIPAFL